MKLILLIILIILMLYINNKLNLISQNKQKTSENNIRYVIAPLNDKYIKSTSIPQSDNKPLFNMLFEETSPWSESKGIIN